MKNQQPMSTTNIIFDNLGNKPISSKAQSLNAYLLRMWPYFDRIEVYSTAGDIRPPYHFQWRALAKPFEGDDDGYEGIGGTPFEAGFTIKCDTSVICQHAKVIML